VCALLLGERLETRALECDKPLTARDIDLYAEGYPSVVDLTKDSQSGQ